MVDEMTPLPVLTVDDTLKALQGLSVGAKYRASFLYGRYVTQQREQGNEPVHASVFGRMLGRLGCQRRRIGTGTGVQAAWVISRWAFEPANIEAVRIAVEGRPTR